VIVARRIVKWWYSRRIGRETQEKEILKTRLEVKIEELKEKSDYYNIQQLLERYDPKTIRNNLERSMEYPPQKASHLQHNQVSDHINRQQFTDNLRLRTPSNHSPSPSMTPPLKGSSPSPQSVQFNSPGLDPLSSPRLPQEPHSRTFLDRLLDLLAGEDENSPDRRYALICRRCKAHNGLAPPGETNEDVGYLCGRCGTWNGPGLNDKGKEPPTNESAKEKDSAEVEETEAPKNE
jgi:endoplasmic reticulum junction formation protein lunapark